jgi:hypothetical protein
MAYKNKQKNKHVLIILIFVMVFSLLNISSLVNRAQAQGNTGKTYTLLEPLPCISTSSTTPCKESTLKTVNLGDFFQYAFNLLIALAAVSAVFMMVWGGFQYMTSDAWGPKNDGLEKFKNAIYGLLMVLSAYLILKTVNPKLVQIPASIPPVNVPSSMKESPLTLFDQLNAEAVKYNQQAKQFTNDLATSEAKVTQLENEKIELRNKLDPSSSTYDPSIDQYAINVEIAKKDSEITNEEANSVINTAKAVSYNAALSTTMGGFSDSISSLLEKNNLSLNKINSTFGAGRSILLNQQETATEMLTALGANDRISEINNFMSDAAFKLEVMRYETIINNTGCSSSYCYLNTGSTSVSPENLGSSKDFKSNYLGELNSLSGRMGTNMTDTQLQKELQDKITKLKTDLNKIK